MPYSKILNELYLRELNNADTSAITRKLFDLLLSEYHDNPYSSQEDFYNKMFPDNNKLLPMTAYKEHLKVVKHLLITVRKIYESDGFTDHLLWHTDLISTVISKAGGLARNNNLVFVSHEYTESKLYSITDTINDRNEYFQEWLSRMDKNTDNMLNAFDINDATELSTCFNNFMFLALQTVTFHSELKF